MSSSRPSDCRPTKSASVSSSCGGHAVSRAKRKVPTATTHAATPQPNHASAIPILGGAVVSEVVATCATPRRYPRKALLMSLDADLRIPLPQRARVRGLPADGRSAAGEVRGVRREPGAARAPSGRRALQGLWLLLDRLRALAQARGVEGVVGRRPELGEVLRAEDGEGRPPRPIR